MHEEAFKREREMERGIFSYCLVFFESISNMRTKKKPHCSTSPDGFQNHSSAVDPQWVLPGSGNIPEVEKEDWLLW